jgi:hypothetical protein
MLGAVLLFVACNQSDTPTASARMWQYPIHLGDSRTAVHQVLTAPTRDTGIIEEYPSSGISVSFDSEGKVAKITVFGPGSNLYSAGAETVPSSQPALFGLSGLTNEAGFRRALGEPATSSLTRAPVRRELQCLWKKGGYLINGEFLAAPRNDQSGNTLPAGTLLWFEVSRGI